MFRLTQHGVPKCLAKHWIKEMRMGIIREEKKY